MLWFESHSIAQDENGLVIGNDPVWGILEKTTKGVYPVPQPQYRSNKRPGDSRLHTKHVASASRVTGRAL